MAEEEKTDFMKWWEETAIPPLKLAMMVEPKFVQETPFNKIYNERGSLLDPVLHEKTKDLPPVSPEMMDYVKRRVDEINEKFATPFEGIDLKIDYKE